MVNENNELLIAKSLGWLEEEDRDIFQDNNKENTREFLDSIGDKNFTLTIISDNGRIYQQSLWVRIDSNQIALEKPAGCDSSLKFIHVFFPKIKNKWNFFCSAVTSCLPDKILLRIPDTVFFLQKRGHRRFPVPAGTKAVFNEEGAAATDTVLVQDISAGGMLICQGFSAEKYPVNSLINRIYITIPPITENGGLRPPHNISPLINQGKIVHSFFNQELNAPCYGISFIYQNSHIKKIVTDFVEVISNRI